MEAMVNFRLTHFLETNNLISKYQNGFRKNTHSTHDHLIRLQTEISNVFRKKQLVAGIFIDIEKAYDMVWRYELLVKAYNMGIKGRMFNFIENFITNRYFSVNVNGFSSNKLELENGISQGSVIAPTLFDIFINDLEKTNDRF